MVACKSGEWICREVLGVQLKYKVAVIVQYLWIKFPGSLQQSTTMQVAKKNKCLFPFRPEVQNQSVVRFDVVGEGVRDSKA